MFDNSSTIDNEWRIGPLWLLPRQRRMIGGTLVLVGLVGMVVAALHPSWLVSPVASNAWEAQWTGGDTVPRRLGELSTRGSVWWGLGLVLVPMAMALARNDRVRRTGGILAPPALAYVVLAVLNAVGIIRLWGKALLTRYPLTDHGMPMSLASGPWWAIAAAAVVTAGALLLATASPPPNRIDPLTE